MSNSLFDSIGGKDAVNAAVDLFYRKVLMDESISHYFESVDMEAQRDKQKSFLTFAFGGPNNYTGQSLREAHAPLVSKGLNENHFTAVAGHLQSTLDELGVPEDLSSQVMGIAAGTINDVLNR
ncbi:group I truncated hemoglobin [Pseudoalteromonas denitrificans]|uniref:Group 1 truncated hemoglobin n=1 Tax=Pseudoalteromonas denitrificans DSM 6059 TaxID=1123010 RepID=A0A1I1FAJ4_9GAMM|nr:group 1 truncated hemoglobin [Pseudoalteromonas denitrificans]SFB96395.1 hemoglobin [Pseudoalteromonas denitrificans DSM 6059]